MPARFHRFAHRGCCLLGAETARKCRGADRAQDRLDLIALLDKQGAGHPKRVQRIILATLGVTNQMEQHTEFVTYTVFSGALSERAFDPAVFDAFPADWLAGLMRCG